jgi:hypothetical protein
MVYATPFSRHIVFAIGAPGLHIWSFAMSCVGHAQDALRYIVGGWHVRESSHAGRATTHGDLGCCVPTSGQLVSGKQLQFGTNSDSRVTGQICQNVRLVLGQGCNGIHDCFLRGSTNATARWYIMVCPNHTGQGQAARDHHPKCS